MQYYPEEESIVFRYKESLEPLQRHKVTRFYQLERSIVPGYTYSVGQIVTVKFVTEVDISVEKGTVKVTPHAIVLGKAKISSIVVVDADKITETDAKVAGYATLKDLFRTFGIWRTDPILQVDFTWLEEEIPTEVPEGVELVKFELYADHDVEATETVFLAIIEGTHTFKSAVNLGAMVRTVMYEKGAKMGTPIRIVTVSKEMAWSLQQTIDWAYRNMIDVVATRRTDKVVEVAYIKLGIARPPPKDKMWYHFKKTDGWTIVGEPKPGRQV